MTTNYPINCRSCVVSWYRRTFLRIQQTFHANQPKEISNKKRLSEKQHRVIVSKYRFNGELKLLCRKHLTIFARFGNTVFKKLILESKTPVEYEPPVFDHPS